MSFQCAYCSKRFKHEDVSIEHLIPKCKGGCNHRHNLTRVCLPCNQARKHTPMYQWLSEHKTHVKIDIANKLIKTIDCYADRHHEIKKENARLHDRVERMQTQLNMTKG